MGIVIRQSFKSTFITYAGSVLGAITVIFLFPQFLTPEQIGLTRILLETSMICAFFSQLGVSNAVLRYYPYFRDSDGRHNGILVYALIVPLVGYILLIIFYLIFHNSIILYFKAESPLFVKYINLLLPLAFFNVYISVFEALSSTYLRIVIPRLVREVVIRLLLILITLFFSFCKIKLGIFVDLFVAIYGIAMVIDTIYIFSLINFQIKTFSPSRIPKSVWKEILFYLIFTILAGLGSNLVAKIDVIMISSMIGLSFTGIYSIAFFMASTIEMPSRSIIQISSPILSDFINKEEWIQVEKLYKQVTLNQFIIGGLIFLLIWINIDNIFNIIPKGSIYHEGKYVVFFIGLAKLFDVITGINFTIIAYSKYFRYSLLLVIFLVGLTILTNWLLIPILGITGAAIAAALSVFLNNIVALMIVYTKNKIHPFSLHNISTFILLIVCYVINRLLPEINNPWVDLFFRSGIVTSLYIFTILKLNLSDDISNIYKKVIERGLFVQTIKSRKRYGRK